MYSLGIDVGGMTVKAGLVDESFNIVGRASAVTPVGDAAALADVIAELAFSLCSDIPSLDTVGVTIPGTVDDNGVAKKITNLGLFNVPLGSMLEETLGHPVRLVNDADAAALAEMKVGALRGVKNGLMLTIGTGLGGAIVIDGRLYKGGLSRGTELGHMVIDRGGLSCGCGQRGCAETLCSATALIRLAQNACNERKGIVYSLSREGRAIDAKLVFDCAAAGDEYAKEALALYVDALSDAVASLVNVLDPQVIVIGGGVSAAGEALLAPLREAAAAKCFFGSCGSIVRAAAGNDAGIIGAATVG